MFPWITEEMLRKAAYDWALHKDTGTHVPLVGDFSNFAEDIAAKKFVYKSKNTYNSINNLRERLIADEASRLDQTIKTGRIFKPDGSSRLLSANELEELSVLQRKHRNDLMIVKKQNAAERDFERSVKDLTPLEKRVRIKRESRNKAFAGSLERERRKAARLTARTVVRAKAAAAARRRMEIAKGEARTLSPLKKAEMEELSVCAWLQAKKQTRREVWFARKLKQKRSFEARHARRHVRHMFYEAICGG